MAPAPVFSLSVLPRRLEIASDDVVTAVGAVGGLLWVGTEAGRLLRYDTPSNTVSEMRYRMGSSLLPAAVVRIFADPFTKSALIILRTADAYYASASGELRPRVLTRLRGMRCVAATFVRVPASTVNSPRHGGAGGGSTGKSGSGEAIGAALFRRNAGQDADEKLVVVALLGTLFGSVFLLTLDYKNEREDGIRKVWAAPSGERIDGIRVERIADNFVGTVATASALYSLYSARTLEELFSCEEGDAVQHVGDMLGSTAKGPGDSADSSTTSFESPLPSDLQFMSSSLETAVASRKFVWAAECGILHAQLSLRSRRANDSGNSDSVPSSVTSSVVERSLITWSELKRASGSSVPMACNLSTFHTLVLYPGSVYCFNQISNEMTEVLDVWKPEEAGRSRQSNAGSSAPDGEETEPEECCLLSSPAAGFVRDTVVDKLWIYTVDGQLGQVKVGEEEQRVAWLAAKTVGRFDLAMALAPLVSGANGDVVDFTQSREAVLEAQADHAAASGDWDSAARLYAKTLRPIEAVIADIVDACARDAAGRESQHRVSLHAVRPLAVESDSDTAGDGQVSDGAEKLQMSAAESHAMGDALKYSSVEATKLCIAYLVSKLDTISESRPSQRTIVATLLVQLYASYISQAKEESAEVRKDFGHFLVDHSADVHLPTAVSLLSSHRCYVEAHKLCLLACDFRAAAEVAILHYSVEDALKIMSEPDLAANPKNLAGVLQTMTTPLVSRGPEQLANTWREIALGGNPHLDHMHLLAALARVSRSPPAHSDGSSAYTAAVSYARFILTLRIPRKTGESPDAAIGGSALTETTELEPNPAGVVPLSPVWHGVVRLLFALHAERGSMAEAEESYDSVVQEHEVEEAEELRETLGDVLLSGFRGEFWGLLVRVYGALGLHEAAVALALEHADDGSSVVAERHVLSAEPRLSPGRSRSLWRQIAGAKGVDVLGVVSRSNGALRVDHALPLMDDFSQAGPRVTSAVAESLSEHQKAAHSAASDATHTLTQIAAIRRDILRAEEWAKVSIRASCGHVFDSPPCPWCGPGAISSLDSPLL